MRKNCYYCGGTDIRLHDCTTFNYRDNGEIECEIHCENCGRKWLEIMICVRTEEISDDRISKN